jgi:hypothetical protein
MTPEGGRARRGAAPGRGRGRRAASFVRGYRNRNPLVLLVAILLLAPALLAFESYFASGAWSDIPLKYWLRNSSDDWTYVSWTVAHNRRHPPSVPSVYLLGGSMGRETTVSDASLARRVRQAGGPRIAAFNVCSIMQNYGESLAITDNVPDTPTLLIVGVNPGRFTRPPEESERQAGGRELLLDSPFLRDYVNQATPFYRDHYTILPGVFGFLASYAEYHKNELLKGHVPTRTYRQHRYDDRPRRSEEKKREMVRRWNTRRAPLFRKYLDYNLAMLGQLLERARQRGVDVILMELPFNWDVIGTDLDWVVAAYQPKVQALADTYGVAYIDFTRELPLTTADYWDLMHLLKPGREIWEQRLAEEIAAFFARKGEDAAAGDVALVSAP